MPPGDERPLTPSYQPPEAKLARNVREICRRVLRGKAAAGNASVRWHIVLRIAAILLSSLGSVGVIADKATGNLPQETGWAFWGSVVLLVFGILSQIANEFQVGQRAMDSRSLAERCALYEIQLENILVVDDPQRPVAELLLSVNQLFEGERYARILPPMTREMEAEAIELAERLLARNSPHWQLTATAAGPRAARRPRTQPKPTPDPPEGGPDERR